MSTNMNTTTTNARGAKPIAKPVARPVATVVAQPATGVRPAAAPRSRGGAEWIKVLIASAALLATLGGWAGFAARSTTSSAASTTQSAAVVAAVPQQGNTLTQTLRRVVAPQSAPQPVTRPRAVAVTQSSQ